MIAKTMHTLLLAVALSLTGLAAHADAHKMNFAELAHTWIDKLNSGDTDGLVALYADDAVFWATSRRSLTRDKAGTTSYFAGGLEKFPGMRAKLVEIVTQDFGETAINSGIYEFSNLVDGVTKWTVQARFSFVYAKRGDDWLIVNHHSSAMPKPPK